MPPCNQQFAMCSSLVAFFWVNTQQFKISHPISFTLHCNQSSQCSSLINANSFAKLNRAWVNVLDHFPIVFGVSWAKGYGPFQMDELSPKIDLKI
jgi:hypothetical protein